jgi:hypothetical protein
MSFLDFRTANTLPRCVEVSWLWGERIASGTLAMLGGAGGVGKSILVAGLEVAVAAGLPFLDAEVLKGDVIHLDFDTGESLQGPWYRRAAAGLGLSDSALKRIRYAVPAGDGPPYLTVERLEELGREIKAAGPVLVVVDAYASAFPYIRSNDMGQVAQVMAALRALAQLGPAVLVLDHTPKPVANGPSALERGLIGSTIKQAGARAVHLLQRVPPGEVGGRDIQALHTIKNNLAPLGEPWGVERTWHPGGAVTFTICDLPEAENRAPALNKALRVIRELISASPIARKVLLSEVLHRANVGERTIKAALAKLVSLRELTRLVEGRETLYCLADTAQVDGNVLPACPGAEKHDKEGSESGQTALPNPVPFAQAGRTAQLSDPEPEVEV